MYYYYHHVVHKENEKLPWALELENDGDKIKIKPNEHFLEAKMSEEFINKIRKLQQQKKLLKEGLQQKKNDSKCKSGSIPRNKKIPEIITTLAKR